MKRLAGRSIFLSLLLYCLLLTVFCSQAFATTTLVYPKFQAFDSAGLPLAGGLVYTYQAGTTTEKTTYSDKGLTTAHENPVELDSDGENLIYGAGPYKFVLKTSAGELVWTVDNIEGITDSYVDYYYPDYSAADQGVTGDGNTVKYAVDTAIGSDTGTIYFRNNSGSATTTYTFSTSETIPSNITCVFQPGAFLADDASNASLTINGGLDAEPSQKIFDWTTGTGSVVFGGEYIREVYAGWWGALASATAAVNAAAFQEALDAMAFDGNNTLYIPNGFYEIDAELTKTSASFLKIEGAGHYCKLIWTGANYATMLALTGGGSGGLRVTDITFDLNNKASTGLKLANFGNITTVERCKFQYGLDNLVGNVITVSDISAGVCTTTNTQSIAIGQAVTFLTGALVDASDITKYIVVAVTANTEFTIDETGQTLTYASAHTCQRTSTEGMLNVTLDGESHTGRVEQCLFNQGTSAGITMGQTGASSGSGSWVFTNNSFRSVANYAIKAKGMKESEVSNNTFDHSYAIVNGGGFFFDAGSTHITFKGNHMENSRKPFITLNLTSAATTKATSGRIVDNFLIAGGYTGPITLGYTYYVAVEHNSAMGIGGITNWLNNTTNAVGTIVGRNNYANGLAGGIAWHEQYITATAEVNYRNGYTVVHSTAALLTLTSQADSGAWVKIDPVSTGNTPNIPDDVRAFAIQASIKSTTPGARLYLTGTGGAAWGDRATDTRVQYLEAQVNGRYNTATFIIPVLNTTYQDELNYAMEDGGGADIDVVLKVVGYLMPT